MPEIRSYRTALLACTFPLLLSLGCNRLPDPQKTFEHVQHTFVSGDLLSAQSEARSAYQRFAGRDDKWALKFRLLEAEILVDQGGNSQEVLSLTNFELPTQLATGDLAIKQRTLRGSALVLLGRFAEADWNLNEAERLSLASQSHLEGEIARARGVLERRQNNLNNADDLFRKSLRYSRKIHDQHLELTDLLDLGTVTMLEEHFDESIDWSNDAYRAAHILRDQSTGEAALGNLGWAYYKMGDFDRALALYQDAEKNAHELGASYDQILWLNNIGLVYYQLNQLSIAEEYYRRSLALAQKSEARQPTIDALTSLAFVSVQKGQLQEAQRYGDEAFKKAHEKNDRASELYPLLVRGQVAAGSGDHQQAEKVFIEVANAKESDLSLRWQAQNDLAELYEGDHRFPEADTQYQQALATIEQSRATLQHEEFKLPFLANAAHLYDDYIRFLVKHGKDQRALQEADYSRARTLAEGLGVLRADARRVDPQQIARQAHATILFYWLGRKQSYLWAINGSHTERFPLPPAVEIDAAVERYLRALLGWQDVLKTANADGSHLYDILVAPAQKLIAPNSRVILITDGSLDGLNFETLLASGSPESSPPLHYWIEDATVLSASSLHVLAAAQKYKERGTGKLLLIGDATAASPEYAPLPNAAQEIENIQNQFPADALKTYTHDQATPSAYLGSDPGQFSYIHFVAHATASKLSPLDSAIVLSRSSAEQDSFKLYARDITEHPLHADLVTISSCEGAGTEAYTGEGLIGLSWAFVRAGAHNVIGALWAVNDASTAKLMGHLYDGLKHGQPPDAALRSAKLSLLHSGEIVRKPFYWAPFQLYIGR
jgi:CHAT domain-containing protein